MRRVLPARDSVGYLAVVVQERPEKDGVAAVLNPVEDLKATAPPLVVPKNVAQQRTFVADRIGKVKDLGCVPFDVAAFACCCCYYCYCCHYCRITLRNTSKHIALVGHGEDNFLQ